MAVMSSASPTSFTPVPPPPPYAPGAQSMALATRGRAPHSGTLQAFGRPQGVTRAQQTAAWLRDYLTAVKHGRWHPFTSMERRVREATRNEPWGPTGMVLNELADASFNFADCRIIFAVLEFRLAYPAAKWRNVYKALTVLEFLLKRGSDACVAIARDDMMFRLDHLARNFDYFGPEGRDHGINVRHRAGAIFALMKNEEQLAAEREQFAAKRRTHGAYSGISSADAVSSYGGGSGGSGGRGGGFGFGSPTGRGFFHEAAGRSDAHEPRTPENAPRLAQGNAGETKGVSLEENRRHLAALREMLQQPANKMCADCGAGRSSWASVNCGVFVCLICAGAHRGLGVHVSKVRSCSLDTWLPAQVAFMAATGNGVAGAFWEARLPGGRRPGQGDAAALEAFIRAKYEARAWARGEWPPPEALEMPEPEAPEAEQPAEGAEAAAAEADAAAAAEVVEAAAEAGRFRERQRQLEREAAYRRRPSPNVMDIDAAWDEVPLAWAGATIVTHGGAPAADDPFAREAAAKSAAAAAAAEAAAAAAERRRAAQQARRRAEEQQQRRRQQQPQPAQPPAQQPVAMQGVNGRQQQAPESRPQGQRSSDLVPPAPMPASFPPQPPQQREPPKQQQPQPRQQPPMPQPPTAPSVMDAAGPRRPAQLVPTQDPFAPSAPTASQQQQRPQQQQFVAPRAAAAAPLRPPAGPNAAGPAPDSSAFGSASGAPTKRQQRRQPDAAAIARARSAMGYQNGGGFDAAGGWAAPPGSPMSVAQAALDRLARAKEVAVKPVLPPEQLALSASATSAHESMAQPPQQQPSGQLPMDGPPAAPQIYTSRFSSRPRRPYNPLGAAASGQGAAPTAAPATSPTGATSAAGNDPARQTAQPPQQQQQQQQSEQQRQPLTEARQHARPPSMQQASYGSYRAPAAQRQRPFGSGAAASASEPTGIDAIGSGGLGFRAPVAPRVSPIEAMRQQMRQQVASGAARAVAPLLHRMTPIKAIKSAGAVTVSVHSDATGRLPPAASHAQRPC